MEGRLRRVIFGTARGSPANNPGGSTRCRRGPSTHKPSAKHVSSVNVKFFEFTRARTRPATRRSPRAPPQLRRKGPWGTCDRAAHAKSRGQGTTPWSRYVLALFALANALCPRGSCCPRVTSSIRRFLQGARPETALCAARAPPRRRLVSGPAKRVFAKTRHLGRMGSAVDVSDSGL